MRVNSGVFDPCSSRLEAVITDASILICQDFPASEATDHPSHGNYTKKASHKDGRRLGEQG